LRRQNPYDNKWKYLYHHGHLWVDLITVSRVNGPVIGLYDCDCDFPLSYTIEDTKKHRYNILYPFFHDIRQVTTNTKVAYNTLVNNLLRDIPLPNRNELLLFKSYAMLSDADNNPNEYNSDLEVDDDINDV